MTSSALNDMRGRLDEVRLLSQLDPLRTGDATQPLKSNSINRACLVLLSAHFEGFLEDIVVEALDNFVTHGALVEQLPLILRALHTEDHLKQIEPIKDTNTRAPRIERMFISESALWVNGSKIQNKMLRAKMVCGEMNNPGSRETRQFLALLGIDIEKHLNNAGESGLLNQLNGLVARRNAVAHGEASASATFMDVDAYLLLIESLSRHIDIAVAQAVLQICKLSTLPW